MKNTIILALIVVGSSCATDSLKVKGDHQKMEKLNLEKPLLVKKVEKPETRI